jgi:hypothetical protein
MCRSQREAGLITGLPHPNDKKALVKRRGGNNSNAGVLSASYIELILKAFLQSLFLNCLRFL